MIKLHTKQKSNLNYYLFDATEIDDSEVIPKSFENEFGKQPLFSSFCTINAKSYAMIGTLEFLNIDDFDYNPLKIFKSPKNEISQDYPQLESFYLCNFKDKNVFDLILLPLLNDLIKWKIEPSIIKKIPAEDPIIYSFKCTPDEIKYRIKILIPYFIETVFSDYFDNPIFTTKSIEVPVVMAKNINQTSEHQLNSKSFAKIQSIIKKEGFARVINFCESKQWIYFSVDNNDNSWVVINNLKYSTLHSELLQFTHFLDKNDMDVINQWNLLVLNVDIKDDVKAIYDQYSNFNDSIDDPNSIKKILAIETYEDSESKNAKIQFLDQSDAYETLKSDPERIKIFAFSMIVHHFDAGKEKELSRIFKKATYIIEKQNNSQRTRPIYHVFFDSKSDLSDALLYSGTIDKSSIAAENDDETTNSKYVYKLSQGENTGIYSNGLRAFCIAYRPNDDVDKIDNQLIKQSWKQNTIEIFDINSNVQLSDAIEALTSYGEDCCLESIIFKRKSIVASFLKKYHFHQAIQNKTIKINGIDYSVVPKKNT